MTHYVKMQNNLLYNKRFEKANFEEQIVIEDKSKKNYLPIIRWKKKKFIINKFIIQSRLHFDSLLIERNNEIILLWSIFFFF